jgi:hypothetical protein
MEARKSISIALAGAAAVALGVVLAPVAHSQIQATPSYQPVGVATSGNQSTAWFHEPSSRQLVACTTVAAGTPNASIACASTKLP